MMKLLQILAIASAFSFYMVPLGHGAGPSAIISSKAPSSELTIRGDVLMIEGEFYFIKDTTGHEVRLQLNNETKSQDKIKVGDKIEARITPDGHAESIAVLIPENVSVPLLPNMAPVSP